MKEIEPTSSIVRRRPDPTLIDSHLDPAALKRLKGDIHALSVSNEGPRRGLFWRVHVMNASWMEVLRAGLNSLREHAGAAQITPWSIRSLVTTSMKSRIIASMLPSITVSSWADQVSSPVAAS